MPAHSASHEYLEFRWRDSLLEAMSPGYSWHPATAIEEQVYSDRLTAVMHRAAPEAIPAPSAEGPRLFDLD